jgi:uncharacterized membrane protein
MTERLGAAALLAATITMGIVSGVLLLYASTIMPGLRRADNRTFVGAFQQMDHAIINPWFMASFFGALVCTGLAFALHLGAEVRAVRPWIAAALLLYLGVVVITLAVHVPLNDALKAAGAPDRIADLAAVRERFNEARWVRWNLVRAVACMIGFGCLAWALVLHGRA